MDQRVHEGQTVAFECLARGRPPPQQTWVFNGRAIANDSHFIVLGTSARFPNLATPSNSFEGFTTSLRGP